MTAFQRILVPIDFSPHATGALRLALMLANRWRAKIHVIHVDAMPGAGAVVVEPIYVAPQLFEGVHAEHDAAVARNMQEVQDELVAGAAPGVRIESRLLRGSAVDEIVSYASEWPADLIIMGSQGASGFAHLVLGSTAEKVSRVAPCPVLIAGRADDTEERPPSFGTVLAAIDYSDFSIPVARLGALMTEPGGTLELLHVWNAPYVSALNASLGGAHDSVASMQEAGRRAQAERLEAFARNLDVPGITIARYVGQGTPAAGILDRAAALSADLIVLGAHGRRGVGERIIGTVADRVLRHARIPVLLYPEGALFDDEAEAA